MSFVYFLRPVGQDGPIKIGCSRTPHARLSTYMSWSPLDLEIVATVKGDLELEARLHSRFHAAHRRNEWFDPAPDLVAAVEALQRGEPIERAVDFAVDSGSIRKGKKRQISPEAKECAKWALRVANKTRWAGAKINDHLLVPGHISNIIQRWRGEYQRPETRIRPSAAEFEQLEKYVAGLPASAERYEDRFGRPFVPFRREAA